MKRKLLVTLILVLFLVPAVMAAESMKFVTAKAAPQSTEDVLIVPVNVTNNQELVALDIPLSFSEGAFLEKVTYTDRVKTFEIKLDQIDNENNTVVIGLISMVTGERPDLAIGTGAVAELHFKLEPGVNSVEINPIEMQSPNHSLTYYWNDYSNGRPEVRSVNPEVEALRYFIPTPKWRFQQNSPSIRILRIRSTPPPGSPLTCPQPETWKLRFSTSWASVSPTLSTDIVKPAPMK
jgi:hypothetical protein